MVLVPHRSKLTNKYRSKIMAIPENEMQFVDLYDPMEQTTHQVVESKFNKWCQEHQSEIYIFMDVYELSYEDAERQAFLYFNGILN